jgi:transcription elongation factor Elf1
MGLGTGKRPIPMGYYNKTPITPPPKPPMRTHYYECPKCAEKSQHSVVVWEASPKLVCGWCSDLFKKTISLDLVRSI